jgi:RNA polymerase sigma factor (sigma-70 family)
MAEDPQSFRLLMQRVREGSPDAARELLDLYGEHIRRVVRRNLSKKLRPKFDSSDFLQSVWATFFADQPAAIDTPEALLAFLNRVARNKVVEAFRQRCQTAKYNVNRERSLEGSAAYQALRVPTRQPTPSQAAATKEEWDQLLERLPAHHQVILDLSRQGITQQEIAQKLNLHERSIRRVLRKFANRNWSYEESPGTGVSADGDVPAR